MSVSLSVRNLNCILPNHVLPAIINVLLYLIKTLRQSKQSVLKVSRYSLQADGSWVPRAGLGGTRQRVCFSLS